MRKLSRRDFLHSVGTACLVATASSLVGCGGSGGNGSSSSSDDIDGVLVKNAKYSMGKSVNGCFAELIMNVKNVSHENIVIYRKSFTALIGENLRKNRADSIGYATEKDHYQMVDDIAIAPGEEKTILVEFKLTQSQYDVITMQYVMETTFYNGNKKQKISIKDKKVTIGAVEKV